MTSSHRNVVVQYVVEQFVSPSSGQCWTIAALVYMLPQGTETYLWQHIIRIVCMCIREKYIFFSIHCSTSIRTVSTWKMLADIEIKNSLRLFGEPCLELLKSVFLVSLFSVKRAAGRGGVKEWSLSHLTSSLNCHLCVLISWRRFDLAAALGIGLAVRDDNLITLSVTN